MLFNSIDFAIFLPIVFLLYWFVFPRNLKIQNLFLLIVSYIFYGWWDWRFLSLIIISSFVDYYVGLKIHGEKDDSKRKAYLWVSILVNLGFLGFFKYFNFFAGNFVQAFSFFGQELNIQSLKIILPVGISFYTFQTMSYTIDIYRKKLEPTKDMIAFFSFVTFFPQLVAGPIERASNLLPQFYKKRKFTYENGVDGMRQILWGLFKKIVIADNCAQYVNLIFNNSADYPGSVLFVGAFLFAFQIYGDFSGYSDIAIGTSRLFGFNLMQNFNFPYFSRDIAEFWRRWHISLSTWFRDYLYIPLGGSRRGKIVNIRNIFIIFIVSGFWHGANWTFIVWGVLNAFFFLPLMLLGKNRVNTDTVAQGKLFPSLKEIFYMSVTFIITLFAWIFFRATDLTHAFSYIKEMFSSSIFVVPNGAYFAKMTTHPYSIVLLIVLFIIIEWLQRDREFGLDLKDIKMKSIYKYSIYYSIISLIVLFAAKSQDFIYFQF